MTSLRRIQVGICLGVGMLFGNPVVQGQNLLTNPGFESGLTGWTLYANNNGSYVVHNSSLNNPADVGGSQSLYVRWAAYGGALEPVGVWQSQTAVEGQAWTFSGWLLNKSADGGVQSDNYAGLQIVFKNGSGGTLSSPESTPLWRDGTLVDQWGQTSVTATAPAGTSQVEFYAKMAVGPSEQNFGGLYFDALSATMTVPVPEPVEMGLMAFGAVFVGAAVARKLNGRKQSAKT